MCNITAFLDKLPICQKHIKTKGKKEKQNPIQNTGLSNMKGRSWAQLTNLKLIMHFSLARCKSVGSKEPGLVKNRVQENSTEIILQHGLNNAAQHDHI